MIELMYNSDFWEVRLNQCELEKMSGEDGLWFESGDDRRLRYAWEDRVAEVTFRILEAVPGCLTEKQREATLLYFCHGKTQREIAGIMGISRRVVSQHLFGITRGGRQVGGAIRKLRKFCEDEGLGFGVRESASS
jgi:DNA-directed RNA polymerase specialized sigma24 family protein